MAKITVKDTEVNVLTINGEDYICLTDMLRAKDGDFFITDWLRNRNTLEFIGIWEKVYNPHFNYGEFAIIKSQSGLNSFKISVKEFVSRTKAISMQAKAGRYGGTYAHKDIAFEFAMWISPEFKIYIVKEFQRLKTEEQRQLGWSAKRELSKINYRARHHTRLPRAEPPVPAGPHRPSDGISGTERQHTGLRLHQRAYLPVEHGKPECSVHRTRPAPGRTPCQAQSNRDTPDADTGK